MKSVVIHCETCDRTQLFRGEDVASILSAIDGSGWRDLPDVDGKYGKGHIPGDCPQCLSNPVTSGRK